MRSLLFAGGVDLNEENIAMTTVKRLALVFTILVSSVGCDQVTKEAARACLEPGSGVSFFGDLFRLQYAENTGAFLSLGSMLPEDLRFRVFTLANGLGLVCLLVFVLLRRNLLPANVAGLSLLIAGGVGNLIDRVSNQGAVIDFLNIGLGNFRTGIFNVADVAIMAGAALLLLAAYAQDNASDRERLE